MFFGSNLVLVIVVLGVILAFVGFGFRTHDAGVILIGFGFLSALAAIIYKAAVTFG